MKATVEPTKRTAIEHLSPAMQGFYRRHQREFRLKDHHRSVLIVGCEAHDRMTSARDRLAAEGLTITTRHGEVKAHPCVAIERDSRMAFVRCMRELGLEDERDSDQRPPRLSGRYQGRR